MFGQHCVECKVCGLVGFVKSLVRHFIFSEPLHFKTAISGMKKISEIFFFKNFIYAKIKGHFNRSSRIIIKKKIIHHTVFTITVSHNFMFIM